MNEKTSVKQEIKELFSKVSATYGEGKHDFFSEFGAECFKHMSMNENACVLDVATGKGAMLFPAIHKLGDGGKAFAIDLSPGMIHETRATIRENNIPHVVLKVMDGEMMEFDDCQFDLVTCGFALFFFPAPPEALAEFKRVLKPKGQVALSTWRCTPDSAFAGGGWFWNVFDKYVPPHPRTGPQPDFGTKEGMMSLLEQAGFSEVRCTEVSKTYYYVDEEEWWQEQLSHGGRRALDRVSKDRLLDFKREVFARLQDYKDSRGVYNRISVLFSYGSKS